MNSNKHPQQRSDAVLLKRYVRESDPHALAILFRRYERLVWSVCARALSNQVDREDAFQATFLTLAEKASRIRKPESLSNWLYGVASRNAWRIRKHRSQSGSSLGNDTDDLVDEKSLLTAVTRQREIDLVDQQLRAMPEKDRTPLVLRYFAGLTAKEIADRMSLTVSATEGRLRRSRKKLRAMLVEAGHQRTGMGPTFGFGAHFAVMAIRPGLLSEIISKCKTAPAGQGSGLLETNLTTGVKIMIYKSIYSIGVTGAAALFMVAAAIHGPVAEKPKQVTQVAANQGTFCDESNAIEIVNVDEATKGSEAVGTEKDNGHLQAFHEHLHGRLIAMHNSVHAHFRLLADFIHGN